MAATVTLERLDVSPLIQAEIRLYVGVCFISKQEWSSPSKQSKQEWRAACPAAGSIDGGSRRKERKDALDGACIEEAPLSQGGKWVAASVTLPCLNVTSSKQRFEVWLNIPPVDPSSTEWTHYGLDTDGCASC